MWDGATRGSFACLGFVSQWGGGSTRVFADAFSCWVVDHAFPPWEGGGGRCFSLELCFMAFCQWRVSPFVFAKDVAQRGSHED